MNKVMVFRELPVLGPEVLTSDIAREKYGPWIDDANSQWENIVQVAKEKSKALVENRMLSPQGRVQKQMEFSDQAAAEAKAVLEKKQPAIRAALTAAEAGIPTFPKTMKADRGAGIRLQEIRRRVLNLADDAPARLKFLETAAALGKIEIIFACLTDDPMAGTDAAIVRFYDANDAQALKDSAIRAANPGAFLELDAVNEVVRLLRSNLNATLGSGLGRSPELISARAGRSA